VVEEEGRIHPLAEQAAVQIWERTDDGVDPSTRHVLTEFFDVDAALRSPQNRQCGTRTVCRVPKWLTTVTDVTLDNKPNIIDGFGKVVGPMKTYTRRGIGRIKRPFLLRGIVAVTAAALCIGAIPAAHAAPPTVRVIKTEQLDGTPRAAVGRWAFTLSGPDTTTNGVFDPSNPGPKSVKRTNENGRGNWINWSRPVGDYRLCEQFWAGWSSNLGGSDGFPRPNGTRCVEFSLSGEDIEVFRVNNRCSAARRSSR
jgi:hypothetical protein